MTSSALLAKALIFNIKKQGMWITLQLLNLDLTKMFDRVKLSKVKVVAT